MDLREQKCKPCEGGVPPFTEEEAKEYLSEVPNWEIAQENGRLCIRRTFKFKDFKGSWRFFDEVAALAEDEGHHPNILVRWNRVTVTLTTHAIKGLSINDFIMAAKIDDLYGSS